VRQHPTKDVLYLYMKTVERAHLPSKMWERIKLDGNYNKALEQIDERLIYWPKFLIHKCKQRLTRLKQVQIRTRRIASEEERLGEKLVPKLAPKVKHREQAREQQDSAHAPDPRTTAHAQAPHAHARGLAHKISAASLRRTRRSDRRSQLVPLLVR